MGNISDKPQNVFTIDYSKGKTLSLTVAQNRLLPCLCGNKTVRYKLTKGGRKLKTAPIPKVKNYAERVRAQKILKKKAQGDIENVQLPEDFYTRVPIDDVWIQSEYPTQTYSFSDIIAMHREYCAPDMFNNKDGLIQFEASIDTRTKKQTKFLRSFSNILVLPHYFSDGTDMRVVAVCQTAEEKDLALSMGAVHAGGQDIIKSIQRGDIRPYEYDYLLCTVDMLADVTKIRKVLKDSFPNQRNGTLGIDMKSMIERFTFGKKYEAIIDEDDLATGKIKVFIGKLDMPEEQLQENLQYYIDAFDKYKRVQGNFILDGTISVVPFSGENFYLSSSELLISSKPETEDVDIDDQKEHVLENQS